MVWFSYGYTSDSLEDRPVFPPLYRSLGHGVGETKKDFCSSSKLYRAPGRNRVVHGTVSPCLLSNALPDALALATSRMEEALGLQMNGEEGFIPVRMISLLP